LSSHFHKLAIKDIRWETSECVSIAFEIPENLKKEFDFTHGQNITVRAIINNEEIRRSYSICTSPLEKELRIAVKKLDGGIFSSYATQLKRGDNLELLPPTGKFSTPINPSHKKDYLAFVAGSGITPIISIIKTVLATEEQSSFTLIYGNKNRSSIIFKEELEAIKNKYINRFVCHHILSREQTELTIYHGRINPEKCEELCHGLVNINDTDEIFLCGPEQMIFSIKDWLVSKKINEYKIHFELFTIPGQSSVKSQESRVESKNIEGKYSLITIKQDGLSFDFGLDYNGEPILDAALKKGAALPYACKGGVCCTCRAKLVEGKVEMEHNYALEPDELEKGFILTCQSHPRTEKLVIDFDVK